MIVADRTLSDKGQLTDMLQTLSHPLKTLKWKKKVNVNNTRMTTEQNVMLI